MRMIRKATTRRRSAPQRRLRDAAVFLAVAIATGCGGPDTAPRDALPGDGADAADAPAAGADTAHRTRTDEGAAAPERDWTSAPVRAEHRVTAVATLRAVRTARHDGFERIVFEFEGDELPSYEVRHADGPARDCGSGYDIALPGDARITIRFEPARAHDDEGRATVVDRDRSPGYPRLLRLRTTCDFEAHLDWVAALDGAAPFGVLELRDPARLVVDLRAEG
jgi:hypothetical protein